jgi:hypothetical protein
MKRWLTPLTRPEACTSILESMDSPTLDALRASYKTATDLWVASIRTEEALATPDHSMTAMEQWDAADFTVQDAAKKAKEARDLYKDGLRKIDYGF